VLYNDVEDDIKEWRRNTLAYATRKFEEQTVKPRIKMNVKTTK